MRFRINMYRLRSERALEVRRKLRYLALFVFLLGVSVVVAGLFFIAVAMTEQNIADRAERIESANAELRQSLDGGTDAMTDDELSLIRMRRVQTEWSDVLAALAHAMPDDMWLTRIQRSQGSLVGRGSRTAGLRIEGRLTAGGSQESLEELMEFIAEVKEERVFVESFTAVSLMNSRWETSDDERYLEFDIFCATE